jgi:hypothetical protein
MTTFRKFGNKPTVVDGIRFDSKREAGRWQELRFLEKAGHISGLTRQVPYKLFVNSQLITTYKADFVYVENGREVVEDSKGYRTPEFKLKAKLFEALYGFKILET